MGFFAFLWRLAKAWPDPGMGIRPGSTRAVFFTFLVLLFGCIAAVLALFGVAPDQMNVWLDAHAALFDAIGTMLFKALLGFVLLICVIAIAGAVFDRNNPERPGIGCVVVALLIGYFAWVGIFME